MLLIYIACQIQVFLCPIKSRDNISATRWHASHLQNSWLWFNSNVYTFTLVTIFTP